jgi:transcriptional regulator with XRE-family HTH domain
MMSIVSERLAVARSRQGLSRYQAAGSMGLAERRLRQHESGEAHTLSGDLAAYAALYGVSESWLRGGPLRG